MLGIRHYSGCAIDLWLGDRENFVCDLASDDLVFGLRSAQTIKARHFVFTPGRQTQDVMTGIKKFLDSRKLNAWPKRITVIPPDKEDYNRLQEELFQSFP